MGKYNKKINSKIFQPYLRKIELLEKERKRLEKLVEKEHLICKIAGDACIQSVDIPDICEKILSEFVSDFNFDYGVVYLKDKEKEIFSLITSEKKKEIDSAINSLFKEIIDYVMDTKKSIFVFDAEKYRYQISKIDKIRLKKCGIRTLICLPIASPTRIFKGAIGFMSFNLLDYTQKDKALFKLASKMFSVILENKYIERELIETGKRYRALLEHLPVGVYRSTPEGRIIEANQALANILGYKDVSELKKINVNDLYVKKIDRIEHLKKLEKSSTFFSEFELKRRDNTTIWVRDYPRAIRGPKGDIIFYDGILVDITERKKTEEALKQSERDYRELFENAHDAIIIFSIKDEIILDVNQRACELYGFSKEEFIGMSLESISKNVALRKSRVKKTLERGVYHNFESIHYRKDGTEMILEINGAIVNYKGKKAILSINRDITERKRMEKTIRDLAYQDHLTGLPNRLVLNDRLKMAIAHAQRKAQKLALMFLDIDQFKDINDTLGHRIGDILLKDIATRLKNLLRKTDTVARMGGDEFVILLPEITREENAIKIAEKILKTIQKPYVIENHKLFITTSIGIAFYPKDGEDVDTLMKNADFAMYQAKNKGKNNYQCYSWLSRYE